MRMMPVVLAIVATASSVIAQQTIDPALRAAIAARDKAAIARDADTVAKYTADDYFAITPGGALNTKKQRIEGLRRPAAAGATPQPALRIEAVRMYGPNAAVVRTKVPDGRTLNVWVKNAQGWQAAAIHNVPDAVTPPAPPAAPPKTAQPTPVTPPAGLTGDGAAVFAAFKAIQDAFYAADQATTEKYRAADFVRIFPGGEMRFGSEGTGASPTLRAQPKYSNVSVHVWSQLGVVSWRETNAAGRSQWLTRVMTKNGSQWQQVTTASSTAANPPVQP